MLLMIVEGRGWGYQKRSANWHAEIQDVEGAWYSLTDRREVNMTRGVKDGRNVFLRNK
jgi:hypothetical protein